MYCTPSNSENQRKRKTGWIDDLLKQLCELDEEIAEEGYPPVSDNAKLTAKQILVELDSLGINPPTIVYSTMDGEIAISSKSQNYSFLILIVDEENIESYSSFFNSDTECNKYTAPFKDFFDYLKTRLHQLDET